VGTRRRSGEPRHETRSGVDGISFTVHPLGTCTPFDRICAARIRRSRSLTWLLSFGKGQPGSPIAADGVLPAAENSG